MSEGLPVCAVCGGACEEGFLQDTVDLGHMTAGTWVEGQPTFSGGILVGGTHRRHYRLQAFRCVKCGKVELRALTEVS